MEELRKLQNKPEPTVKGHGKVSITSLMAAMAAEVVLSLQKQCIIVLDAYFAVGPVFLILKEVLDTHGGSLVHVVTRAKNNVVGFEPPPPRTGRRGAPRKYGQKVKLMRLFESQREQFQEITIDLYGQGKSLTFLCVDLFWKPIKDKVRFVLVEDGKDRFILLCSDLTLNAQSIIKAYSYRFKIEVNFKVLKHLMGAFFYHFWTKVWPGIKNQKRHNFSQINDPLAERLIKQATDAIEGFVNFACIATGILQILALNCHQSIWDNYRGWLRTITSTIPSEEVVRSVVQQEYFHNFHTFSNTAIYQIIMSKSRKLYDYTRSVTV